MLQITAKLTKDFPIFRFHPPHKQDHYPHTWTKKITNIF